MRDFSFLPIIMLLLQNVAELQVICLGVTKMKTISIGLTVPCVMPMPSTTQAINSEKAKVINLRACTYI